MKPLRLSLAALSILAAAACFIGFEEKELAFWSFPALAALSPVLLLARRSGAQIAARAIWASTTLLGALGATFAWGDERLFAVGVLGFGALALLFAGGIGLGAHRGATFQPSVFRRSLVVSLVFVALGAQWLAILAGSALHGHVSESDQWMAAMCLGGLATLGAGFFGVLRLKVWGFVLTALGCSVLVALGAVAAAGAPDTEPSIVFGGVAAFFSVPLVVAGRVMLACLPGMKKAR